MLQVGALEMGQGFISSSKSNAKYNKGIKYINPKKIGEYSRAIEEHARLRRSRSSEIYPPDQIAGVKGLMNIPLAHLSGVYFLCRRGRVVYVGQSRNVYARVTEHWSAWRTSENFADAFDSIYVLPVSIGLLMETERKFIRELRPPWNITGQEKS